MNMFYARLLVIVLVVIGVLLGWGDNSRSPTELVAEMSKSGGL